MNATPGIPASESPQLNFALLIMRLACALPFLYHGSAILFGYLVGLAQFAGGLAILTGAFLRVGAVCVVIVMFGAIFQVHFSHGFDIGRGGYEYALTELLLAFGLLIAGPGAWSLRNVLPAPLRKL